MNLIYALILYSRVLYTPYSFSFSIQHSVSFLFS
jgi:hypothetical protein